VPAGVPARTPPTAGRRPVAVAKRAVAPSLGHVSHDDALSLSMFWAGALMVFTPLLTAAAVIAFVWWQRAKDARGRGGRQRSERGQSEET
jgi:hypothetical protein